MIEWKNNDLGSFTYMKEEKWHYITKLGLERCKNHTNMQQPVQMSMFIFSSTVHYETFVMF